MLRIVLPCAFVLAIISSASADHCSTWSTWTHGVVEADTPVGTYYVFGDGLDCEAGCFWTPWIYQESNDLQGLQRLDPLVDDTCHGMVAPDTLIF